MTNKITAFNEQELKKLIGNLQAEKEKYQQEKTAKQISYMKNERTAEMVAELLYSKNAYIRNLAIEILSSLGIFALDVLKEKMSDENRNIRKFALDVLNLIVVRQSCDIAISALNDPDENVVEAALEVIRHQKYKQAEIKLIALLHHTKSVWILNSLITTFETLKTKQVCKDTAEKINSFLVSDIEKNIIVNTYVRALGKIGSFEDIDRIINNYAENYMIEPKNLIFGLTNLIIETDTSKLSEKTMKKLKKIFVNNWNYQNSEQILVDIAAFVKLQFGFFLQDIAAIYSIYRDQDFFAHNLYLKIKDLQDIPNDFILKLLKSKEPDLVILGLRLIYDKHIKGYHAVIFDLCNQADEEVSLWAVRIISDIESYENQNLLEELENQNEEACLLSIEKTEEVNDYNMKTLLSKLSHLSKNVRKAAAEKLIYHIENIDLKLLEEIVKCNEGELGIEALKVLFTADEQAAWKYIISRMNSMDEAVRAGLISIVSNASDEAFYNFIKSMINDPSAKVRKKAIKVLNRRINDRSLKLLKSLYESESNSVNNMEIISNLYKFKNDEADSILEKSTNSLDPLIKLAAIKALESMKNKMAVDLLITMKGDQIDEVREAAQDALIRLKVII